MTGMLTGARILKRIMTLLVEIVLAHALYSNDPIYLNTRPSPTMDSYMQLNIQKDLTKNLYLHVNPYVMRSIESGVTGRAGAEAGVGWHVNNELDIELYHHSSHSLDTNDTPLELDMIKFHWFLSK